MKKTKLLSALTAVAVVATTMGTFAAWDQLESTASTTVDFRDPAIVAFSELTLNKTELFGESVSATGSTTLTLTNIPDDVTTTNYKLNYTGVVKKNNIAVDKKYYTLNLVDSNNTSISAPHDLTVTLTPSTTEAGAANELKDELTVEITARLDKVNP